MLMASQVIAHLATFIANHGDMPCVIEHKSTVDSGAILDPINDVALMTIGRHGSSHVEICALLTELQLQTQETPNEELGTDS